MPVTLDKAPRSFTVLMQDGTVHGTVPTPATEEGRDELRMEAYWGLCVDLIEVTAIDRFDARNKGTAIDARNKAIAQYATTFGVSETVAETVYRDCRHWAVTLSPKERAAKHRIKRQSTIRRSALTEVMRENGEL
ncbi:hypothetical protein [Streptomyces cavernicola]|uniref:Uncharacterized protein n=1 Tax=Streptomyces cavernicola TaxID=3043613 RepID=A0ABT6SM74_9ACTN|nr:hypothetical protein [Streptomyces sp. B-S-A6]MDI3409287.1 hypothetical protein [Streptomyces sp. B-S-A6]